VLGRNDPISFALKLTRSYSSGNCKALDDLGVGKLVVQAGRERDFANRLRKHARVGERPGGRGGKTEDHVAIALSGASHGLQPIGNRASKP
jgi:hypothetical protein